MNRLPHEATEEVFINPPSASPETPPTTSTQEDVLADYHDYVEMIHDARFELKYTEKIRERTLLELGVAEIDLWEIETMYFAAPRQGRLSTMKWRDVFKCTHTIKRLRGDITVLDGEIAEFKNNIAEWTRRYTERENTRALSALNRAPPQLSEDDIPF